MACEVSSQLSWFVLETHRCFRDGGDVWGTWCRITCRHTCLCVCSALPLPCSSPLPCFFQQFSPVLIFLSKSFESAIAQKPSWEVRVFNCGKYWLVLCGSSWSVVLGKQQPVSWGGLLSPNQNLAESSQTHVLLCSICNWKEVALFDFLFANITVQTSITV